MTLSRKGRFTRISTVCGAMALVLAFGAPAGATSPGIVGTFDNAFGVDGTATAVGALVNAGSVNVDAQGRIVVSGDMFDSGLQSIAVARFTKAGAADRSFGLNGTAHISSPVAPGIGGVGASAIAPDGRIVVVGDRFVAVAPSALPTNTVVARLTTTGRRDPTFDGDGLAPPLRGLAIGVKVDGAGRPVVLGFDAHGPVIWRYRTDGRIDPTFGSAGAARIPGAVRFVALALDPANRVVVAGRDSNGHNLVARFTASGAHDASFGSGGVTRFAASPPGLLGIAIQTDGRIVVTGDNGQNAQVTRLLANGTRDPGFGTNGVVSLARIAPFTFMPGVTAVPGGGLVVVGSGVNGSSGRASALAVRLRVNGSIDPTFACGGAAWSRVGSASGAFVGAAATAHDVFAMGVGQNASSALTVSRLRLDPSGPGGYALAASDGGTAAFGSAAPCPSIDNAPLNRPVVGIATTPSGRGRWLVASDGGVFAAGDAHFFGSTGGLRLNRPIVGMAPTPTGRGYWLVASDGGIFAFGDAHFYGSTGNRRLNRPIVGMAPTPTGRGYWLVASDGGIFAFGDAHFYGSTGAMHLTRPVVGMAAHAGNGYWLIASDGGIFSFGGAHYYGSTGAMHLDQPVVGMAATRAGDGYWITVTGGGIFTFGAARFRGSSTITTLGSGVVGIASTP